MSKDIWVCKVHILHKHTNKILFRVILEETVREVAIMFLEIYAHF